MSEKHEEYCARVAARHDRSCQARHAEYMARAAVVRQARLLRGRALTDQELDELLGPEIKPRQCRARGRRRQRPGTVP